MDLFGKQNASNLRERAWKLEEFKEYFSQESAKEGNSEKFQAVAEALGEFDRMQNQAITEESAINMIKASDKLKEACRIYSDSRRNAKSALGRERLAVIDSLDMFREDLNLDQARDMRVVREYEGKTWKEAGKFKMAELDLTDKTTEVMGANVSQRMKVEYENKKGFFTEQFEVRSLDGYIKGIAEGIDKAKEPDLKRVLEANQEQFKTRLENIEAAATKQNRVACSIGEHWNQMEAKAAGKKQLGKTIINDHDTLTKAAEVVQAYQEELKTPDIGLEEKSRLMDKMIEEKLGNKDKKLKEAMRQNKSFFMEVPAPDMELGKSACQEKYFKLAVIQAKAGIDTGMFNSGKKEIQALDRVIEDGNMIHRYVDTSRAAKAAGNATGEPGKLKLDAGMELTSRNVASSRIAELLGIGNIIAHSEKMKVRSGDKVMTGCFMEFAKGVDLNSKSERVQRMLEQTEITSNASFNKDMTTLEVFDYLCSQVDRHSGNMFYQLSEPDKNGKRTVIGIQGIDSDMAFGDNVELVSKTQGQLSDMTFIDKQLAEKISSLNKDSLEYALGDVIPKHQIDIMMQRVEKFQEHMKENMIQIEPDGWELNKYSLDQSTDKLDKEEKAYVEGLKSLQKSSQAKYPWDMRHKNGTINKSFKDLAQERAARPEKVAISFKELQENRPAVRRESKGTLGAKTQEQIQAARQKRAQGRQMGS